MSAPRSALAVRRERALAAEREAQSAECDKETQVQRHSPPKRAADPPPASPKRVHQEQKPEPQQADTLTPDESLLSAPPPIFAMRLGTDANTLVEAGRTFFGLESGEHIILRGVCSVHVLRGSVDLAGACLTHDSAPVTIYAPEVYHAALLCASASDDGEGDVPARLSRWPCVLCVESVACGIELFPRVYPLAGPDPFWLQHSNALGTFVVLGPEHYGDTLRFPSEWNLGELREDARILVRGAKNTGKSSLVRHILNRLLRDRAFVAVLDTDLGQPEFGPPGFVSLHVFDAATDGAIFGPSWCVPRVPVCSYFIGDVSPREDPERLVAAVRQLMSFYNRELRTYRRGAIIERFGDAGTARRNMRGTERCMPLVVNTHGWVKGLGSDILQRIEEAVSPTRTFSIGGAEMSKVTVLPAWPDTQSAQFDSRRRTLNAAEIRSLAIVAYLHAVELPRVGVPQRMAMWNFVYPLVERIPFEVDVTAGLPLGIDVMSFGAHVDQSQWLYALNGALVALTCGPQQSANDSCPWRATFARGLAASCSPEQVNALGLALVRSIDRDNGCVYLLTPLPPPLLASRGARGALGLCKGAIQLPVWASLDREAYLDVVQARLPGIPPAPTLAGVPRQQVPYIEWPPELIDGGELTGAPAIGARPRRVRRNLQRRSQRQ